ncbi:MAG TPA: hypothetical protein P5022_10295, partial [Candidatus Paceibacterota bacterium]|nr:hypothetical protein [Candidatus Paceibacterota bacterium]
MEAWRRPSVTRVSRSILSIFGRFFSSAPISPPRGTSNEVNGLRASAAASDVSSASSSFPPKIDFATFSCSLSAFFADVSL